MLSNGVIYLVRFLFFNFSVKRIYMFKVLRFEILEVSLKVVIVGF